VLSYVDYLDSRGLPIEDYWQNIGLIGAAGYTFYNEPRLQRDTRAIGTTVAAGATLFALEGWGAAAYRQTPRGQAEERRARKEGVVLYNHAREVILRPGVLGGLVGLGEKSLANCCDHD
jgi:hypothetical protein